MKQIESKKISWIKLEKIKEKKKIKKNKKETLNNINLNKL